MSKLHEEKSKAIDLLRTYAAECEDDEDLKIDLLEGATDLFEAFDRYVALVRKLKGWVGCLKAEENDLKARRNRYEDQIERLERGLQTALELIDVKKVERPNYTLSRRRVPPSVIIDPSREIDLPAKYWITPDPRPDRRAILADLKNGEQIPGAQLGNGSETISIRTK